LNNSGKNISLEIWDVSGQERYRSLTNMHYRDADGCILVYDVTDRDSYDNIEKEWLKEIKEKAPEKTQIVLIGNKCDLSEERQVSLEAGQAKASQYSKKLITK
jgi:Ras-related protein Rab-1A